MPSSCDLNGASSVTADPMLSGRSHGQVGPKAAMGYFAYFRLFLCRVLRLEVIKH
jgi:hypothetical protein